MDVNELLNYTTSYVAILNTFTQIYYNCIVCSQLRTYAIHFEESLIIPTNNIIILHVNFTNEYFYIELKRRIGRPLYCSRLLKFHENH